MITFTETDAWRLYDALQYGYASFLNTESAQLAGECGNHARAIAESKAARMLGALRHLAAALLELEFGDMMEEPA